MAAQERPRGVAADAPQANLKRTIEPHGYADVAQQRTVLFSNVSAATERDDGFAHLTTSGYRLALNAPELRLASRLKDFTNGLAFALFNQRVEIDKPPA